MRGFPVGMPCENSISHFYASSLKMAETLVITKQFAVQAGLLAAVSRPSFKLSSHTLSNSEEPPIFRPKTLDNQEFCMYTCFIETFQ